MENLTKKDVFVRVDTKKKARRLLKVLTMFNEDIFETTERRLINNEVSEDYPFICFNFSCGWNGYSTGSKGNLTQVTIKQLKQILAKEKLKVNDIVKLQDGAVIKLEVLDNYVFTYFKRYATKEEIEKFEGKKELEVGEWYWLSTKGVGEPLHGSKLQNALVYNNGDFFTYAFNFIGEFYHRFYNNLDEAIRLATPQEVEEALAKEAKRRGFTYDKYEFNIIENILFGIETDGFGGVKHVPIFKSGVWSEVVDKFAELKEAHKNGAVIEFKNYNGKWIDCDEENPPLWFKNVEYRIKPDDKPKVGDVCKFWDKEDRFIIGIYKEWDGSYHRHTANYGGFNNAKKLSQQEVNELLFGK